MKKAMNKVRKSIVRIAAVLLCVVSVVSLFPQEASAQTWGNQNTSTITVKTKKNYAYPGASSITLKQSKQTLTYRGLLNSSKTKTKTGYYGCYTITVTNVTTGKTSTVYWTRSKSIKIKMDGNCTYSIKVVYNSSKTQAKYVTGYILKSCTNPSWSVSGDHKVDEYY